MAGKVIQGFTPSGQLHPPGAKAPPHGNGTFSVDPRQLGPAGTGRPLPDALRTRMEAALGADFSAVRIHVGPQAAKLGAAAFTMGSDVYFAPGWYQPDTVRGQQLLGHELAHVIQQRAGRVRNPLPGELAVVTDRALEAEADRAGQRAAAFQARPQADSVARALPAVRPPLQARLNARAAPAGSRLVQRMEMPNPESPLAGLFKRRDLKDVSDKIVSYLNPQELSRLDRVSHAGLPNVDQLFMIELGAGPMDSAAATGAHVRRTAFTEYRLEEEVHNLYGTKLGDNYQLLPHDFKSFRKNQFKFGVDATKLAAANLPKAMKIRFTNPNIGHQDLKVDTLLPTVLNIINNGGTVFCVSVSDLLIDLDVSKISDAVHKQLKKHFGKLDFNSPLQEQLRKLNLKDIISFISHTAHNVATCRNIRMLELFLANVGGQFYSKRSGRVEIVVAKNYVEQFNIKGLAACLGFQMHIESFELPHDHVQTQENKHAVGNRKSDHVMVILSPDCDRQVQALYQHVIDDPIQNLLVGVHPAGSGGNPCLKWGF